ncbi:bifunctional DNA-formamidopyrimidine glycosylase/DNA-(apurinic or apyrimidinic site) lyase [Komagataeibacter sp. FNDCR2]|uniref:bifunctional DNA-formamidopyrimidine glycosylase/DNA-(apurinic or apyrimidinic site) lyase n=1 Tax=Komagataeibacter sp. FNDCR2 TaxID=2878682 RepID=UPI001E3EB829|nr:bifunctional DNA-formamidopyrimidine glycosylase/DNA-(apurinic or apyrimidinic site) lyase [Komagataeibacter sp. FNDCR2]MCE2576641.1 bifunctional DNA-formamidopyrimidine glycosylase/DNA-(apurinic or apyrimidinic site) lyase [Komagataeibacter sp. FNDCR2]
MPELPEVETVMRGMRVHLEGHTISRASTHHAGLRWPFPPGLARALAGRRVDGFARRGKYILITLSGGMVMVLHLGMSGRILLSRMAPSGPAAAPAPHEHLVIETAQGARCGLVDPRRFGMVDLVPAGQVESHRLLAGMGPEPLGNRFDGAWLAARARGRRSSMKALLLDQRVVAGLGNIYVSEALFRAGIHPARAAGSVEAADHARLVTAIRAVLEEAIAAGGSSLRDYVQPDGALGYFQHAWRVYGREGEGCPDCPGPPACNGVVRITQSGRSSFFCPRLQREENDFGEDLS